MTREEILNMPAGREMDDAICRFIFLFVIRDDGKYYRIVDGDCVSVCENPIPYSTNIAAALGVVNKLAKEPFSWHIESANLKDGRVEWWVCLWGDMPDGSITEFDAQAETIPLAISRVALLSAMEEK